MLKHHIFNLNIEEKNYSAYKLAMIIWIIKLTNLCLILFIVIPHAIVYHDIHGANMVFLPSAATNAVGDIAGIDFLKPVFWAKKKNKIANVIDKY